MNSDDEGDDDDDDDDDSIDLRLGHKRKGKTRSITCRTDRGNEANERYAAAMFTQIDI